MAYQNFVPTVWAEAIERDLERLCVFKEDCNQSYEGKIKDKGQSVTILGVGKPTIKRITKKSRNADIDAPEEVEDTSIELQVNQIAYFNYMVGDIDKAQAENGLMDALSAETSEGLANEVDGFIAEFAADSSVKKMYTSAPIVIDHRPDATERTAGKVFVLDVLDAAIQHLQENDVKEATYKVVTISPRFFTLFKRAYIMADTNNSEMLKNGKVGMYGNITVKMSNDVKKSDDGKTDYIMMRTKRAISFVLPHTHTEAYRPEKKFADAVKGFILFDGKVTRPKEVITMNVKYA